MEEDGLAAAVQAFHASLSVSRPVARVFLSRALIDGSELSPHVTRDWEFIHEHAVCKPKAFSDRCM